MINFAKIWDILITKFPAFMEGVEITLQLAFFTVLFGSLLGLVVAVCRRTRLLPLRWLMNAYVAFIRGTPLLVQVLLVVYGLPQLGIRFPRMTLCIIALVINSGAYMAELIRAGLQSVEKGQVEAAESLGMSSGQTMLYIILPQAVKVTLPAMGNEFVAIIKESSILYAVGVYELTYQAYKLASVNYYYIETMIVAALIYFVLTYVATKLLGLLERRMRRADTSAA
ncbi:MAG TPA: amino acid ABC transporter permease [Candidatus Egerieenecus merdigallinarum]|jgi:His/Glu/Gln/Arg/opine family amino acid ABC transporter permease subunit|nr:amino acid ABC transporter permease [Candidatus Egerieenecus merdigallinarum]